MTDAKKNAPEMVSGNPAAPGIGRRGGLAGQVIASVGMMAER